MKVFEQHLLVHYVMHVVEHEMSSHEHQVFSSFIGRKGRGGTERQTNFYYGDNFKMLLKVAKSDFLEN